MYQDAYFMPRSDRWIVERLAAALGNRLVSGLDDRKVRPGMMRCLYALQRLPHKTTGISINLSVGFYLLEFNREEWGITRFTEDGHTLVQLQYFEGSHHCIDGFNHLGGFERENAIDFCISDIEGLLAGDEPVQIEDYSDDAELMTPPLDSAWEQTHPTVYFDLEPERSEPYA